MSQPPVQTAFGLPLPPRPSVGRLDTVRFYLRSLVPADAHARWIGWLADPEVMHPVNTPTRELSLSALQAHIAKQNPRKRLLVGIFDRTNDLHIGYYRIDLDEQHRLAVFNLIVGDKDYWGRRVVNETRAALLDYLFRKRDIAKAVGMPPARNFPSVFNYREQGWRLEGTLKEHRQSLVGGGRIDQLVFGMTKEDWITLRRQRQT